MVMKGWCTEIWWSALVLSWENANILSSIGLLVVSESRDQCKMLLSLFSVCENLEGKCYKRC